MDYASIVGLVTFLIMMVMIFAGIPVFVSMLASAALLHCTRAT